MCEIRIVLFAICMAAPGWEPTARAQIASVRMEGGADASGHNYEWTLINAGDSPIVQVELDHYRAILFLGPENWTIHCENLVNVGVSHPSGLCQAKAPAEGGIMPGRRAAFRMQCTTTGTTRGKGEVRVKFADGSVAFIPQVELPQPAATGDRFVPLLGLGLIAGIYFAIQFVRRRTKSKG